MQQLQFYHATMSKLVYRVIIGQLFGINSWHFVKKLDRSHISMEVFAFVLNSASQIANTLVISEAVFKIRVTKVDSMSMIPIMVPSPFKYFCFKGGKIVDVILTTLLLINWCHSSNVLALLKVDLQSDSERANCHHHFQPKMLNRNNLNRFYLILSHQVHWCDLSIWIFFAL